MRLDEGGRGMGGVRDRYLDEEDVCAGFSEGYGHCLTDSWLRC